VWNAVPEQFIVCARTDARGVEGLQATIDRSKAYIDAGADMVFPEGLFSVDEFESVASALKGHEPDIFLLANMTEFGKSPIITFQDFEKVGYDCVIYPVSALRVAMKAVDTFLASLKTTGSVENTINDMLTREELYELLDYTPGGEWIYPNSAGRR